MADPLPERDAGTATPRWVKISGVAAAVIAVLVLVMVLSGHGPGHHFGHDMPMASGATPAAAPP